MLAHPIQTARMEKSIYTHEYAVLLDLLREQREKAGLTQEALAAKIDENQVYVSRYERGESRLDIVQLRCLCQAMGVGFLAFVRRFESRLTEAE